MKPIIRILLIVLLLVLYSCKSIALYDTSTDYDFKFDLYSQVKMYFRANLKYPTVNELWKKGLMDLLSYLEEKKIPAAVATSTRQSRGEKVLQMSGIAEYFAAFIFI